MLVPLPEDYEQYDAKFHKAVKELPLASASYPVVA
jgi:hypothetical protein